MTGDAPWYEAAFVVGVTNALNVVADGLGPAAGAPALLEPVDDGDPRPEVGPLLAGIREFYGGAVPLPLRLVAHDPGYAADLGAAVQRVFADGTLSRLYKEALAFAVSLTTRSRWGTSFHLGEMRRLGVGPRGVMEIVGVTQPVPARRRRCNSTTSPRVRYRLRRGGGTTPGFSAGPARRRPWTRRQGSPRDPRSPHERDPRG
jgi:hypothetical protein